MKTNIDSTVFTEDMTATIKSAVNNALLHHKAVGNKIAHWHKNKIVVEVPKSKQVQSIIKFSENPK